MSYKNKKDENPVGPEEPAVNFRIPLWQVFVALFLIAILVTAWKWYEQNYIAPATAIEWQPFSLQEFRERQRRQRNILVWIQPVDEPQLARTKSTLQQPQVQAAAYQSHCAARVIAASEVGQGEIADWIVVIDPQLAAGGFVMFETAQREPRWLLLATVTARTLADLIAGE